MFKKLNLLGLYPKADYLCNANNKTYGDTSRLQLPCSAPAPTRSSETGNHIQSVVCTTVFFHQRCSPLMFPHFSFTSIKRWHKFTFIFSRANGDVALVSPKQTEEKEADQFDGMDLQTEKLTHPTANRAKPPQRRPPSGLVAAVQVSDRFILIYSFFYGHFCTKCEQYRSKECHNERDCSRNFRQLAKLQA